MPGTILTSYLNIEAIPDPNFGQNQLHISDSYFYADFWYRTEFSRARVKPGELQWLCFDGINWKAEVFLNGAKLGRIDGGVHARPLRRHRQAETRQAQRARHSRMQERHAWQLQAENLREHRQERRWHSVRTTLPITRPSAGIGFPRSAVATPASGATCTSDTGAVTLEDPLVTSMLPAARHQPAEVSRRVSLRVNHTDRPVNGTLRGKFR